jgi:hypothetical protein
MHDHDDFVLIGERGSAEEMRHAISRLPATGDIDGCLGCQRPHWASMFRRLTAHDAGRNAEDWHRWWKANQGRTQADWIRSAFLPIGIDPRRKPSSAEAVGLLRLIGLHEHMRDGFSEPRAQVDEGLGFNAMRILRDHDVEPARVSLDGLSPMDMRLVIAGIARYAEFRGLNQRWTGVGVVFGDGAGSNFDPGVLPFDIDRERWWLRARLGATAASLLLGLWLVRKLWRTRRLAS